MEGYLTEIRFFGPTWAPRNWAVCAGQTMPISSFNAVFSLIGTIYGGDGRTTFNLPDLRGRVAIGSGAGVGLTPRSSGQKGGTEWERLTVNQMPSHNHNSAIQGTTTAEFKVNDQPGTASTPATGNSLAAEAVPSSFIYNTNAPNTTLHPASVLVSGSGLTETIHNNGFSEEHFNQMPFQVILPIICLSGIYPSRS